MRRNFDSTLQIGQMKWNKINKINKRSNFVVFLSLFSCSVVSDSFATPPKKTTKLDLLFILFILFHFNCPICNVESKFLLIWWPKYYTHYFIISKDSKYFIQLIKITLNPEGKKQSCFEAINKKDRTKHKFWYLKYN